MVNALSAADNYPDNLVPLHLRNAPTKLMKELGYQENYQWKAGFQHSKGFLPIELKDLKLFKQ
jgi:putative ATPase